MPSGEAGVFALRRLLASCQLSQAIAAAVHRAASLTTAHLARGHFPRLHTVVLAMLARIHVSNRGTA